MLAPEVEVGVIFQICRGHIVKQVVQTWIDYYIAQFKEQQRFFHAEIQDAAEANFAKGRREKMASSST